MEKLVKAVQGNRKVTADPGYEAGLAKDLKSKYGQPQLLQIYSQYQQEDSDFAKMMRRILLKAMCRKVGNGVVVSTNVKLWHPETMVFGDCVFIGANTTLQGRIGGSFTVGSFTWIGPHCFLDVRDMRIGKYAGIGPGVKTVGSQHTGIPVNRPIIKTDLLIKTIAIKDEADIGSGTVILPGVTIGKGCIIGANAVVNRSIPDYRVAVGVPAKPIKNRKKA